MDLVIVESPTKAKTLTSFLGDGYRVEASMGHVRDLPESKLGIDIKKDFAPEYVVSPKKAEKVKEIQGAAGEAKKVILATDPDREGEAIAWHIAALLKENSKLERITFHEITEQAIKDALAHPGKINMQLVDAQQARRILDRLVGYKLSPILWRKVRKGLSAGRVQSVAVRLIVEREREIQAFVPKEYWEIIAQLTTNDPSASLGAGKQQTTGQFDAKLVKIADKPVEINTGEEASKLVSELEKAEYKVEDIQTKEAKRYPYPPFTTSTLQQAGANVFGWSAKRTMQVAQNLYEQGLITYHRTDSLNLAGEAVSAARKYIDESFGGKYLPESPRFYKTKSKVAQEAHEAIRPTAVGNLQQTTNNKQLDRDQVRLYELIWKRFLACQMSPAEYEQKSIDISAGLILSDPERAFTPSEVEGKRVEGESKDGPQYIFRANGSKQLFDGWQKLFGRTEDDEENGQILPNLTVGEMLQLLKLLPSQHFTEPPARYTEASLIKTLEEYGIGRPSTYAPIISTIQDRQYVEKGADPSTSSGRQSRFQPTNLGEAVNDFLMKNFPKLFDYQFTAHMEDDLDEIAAGEKQWVPVIREFYGPFEKLLGSVQEMAERVKVEVEETDEICPLDGGKLVVRIGRFGKFLACANFPNCKFTKPFAKKLDMKCPKCGEGEVVFKRTKSKKTFYGCSRYPDCDWASWTKPKVASVKSEEANLTT